MNTYTDTQIHALVAAGIDLNEFFGATPAPAPAKKARKQAPVKPSTEKVLTRSAWKAVRTTKAGTVKKAFVGLTREQAHAKGLTPGYRLPTGEMRAVLAQG